MVRKQVRTQARVLRALTTSARDQDPDAIHDVRVASRRLRALLAEHEALFRKRAAKKARERARQVTRALGRARELDVSIEVAERLRNRLRGPARYAATHVVQALRAQRAEQSGAVVETADLVDSDAFGKTLRALLNGGGKTGTLDLAKAARSLRKRYGSVVRAHTAWQQDGTDGSLHALRIEFKKLRYTCEIYREVNGAHLKTFIQSLREVQESLGEWHDYCILRDYAEQAAPSAAGSAQQGLPLLLEAIEARRRVLFAEFETHAELFFTQKRQKAIKAFLSKLKGA